MPAIKDCAIKDISLAEWGRKELEIAATIQRQILPQNLPEFSYVRFGARTVPCTGIGGDFYDVIPLAGGFAAIVGDVSGKGIPAALLGAMAQGMFHAQMASGAALVDAVIQTLKQIDR